MHVNALIVKVLFPWAVINVPWIWPWGCSSHKAIVFSFCVTWKKKLWFGTIKASREQNCLYFCCCSWTIPIILKYWQRTCAVELSRSSEEARQRCLEHHDEILQLLSHSHEQILIHQIILGLFESPPTANIPAQTDTQDHFQLLHSFENKSAKSKSINLSNAKEHLVKNRVTGCSCYPPALGVMATEERDL